MRKVLKQTVRIILFPVIVFLWLVGWTLYYFGSPDSNSQKSEASGDQLDIAVLTEDDQLLAIEES